MINITKIKENLSDNKLTVEFDIKEIIYNMDRPESRTLIRIYRAVGNHAIVLEQENGVEFLTILDEFEFTIDNLNRLHIISRLGDKEKVKILNAFNTRRDPDVIDELVNNLVDNISNLDITKVEKMRLFKNMEQEIERRKHMEF